MTKQWAQRPSGRTLPDSILEGRDLARTLGVQEADLQEIARLTRVPFSISRLAGMWINKRDLPAWHQAAQRWRSR
jgi:hypothetical protein